MNEGTLWVFFFFFGLLPHHCGREAVARSLRDAPIHLGHLPELPSQTDLRAGAPAQ
jgi:hypothetical protein